MTEEQKARSYEGACRHPRVLDYQNPCDDARRNRRRHGYHDVARETTPHPVPGGYLIGTAIFGILLVAFVWAQIRADKFNPWLYWATIVASTTLGTTLADFADQSLGIGTGRFAAAARLRLGSLFVWFRALGTVNVNTMTTSAPGSVLLDHDHVFADPGPLSATGLPTQVLAIPAVRSSSVPGSRCSQSSTSRHTSAACSFSGRRSSSPVLLGRPWATPWTSRCPAAVSRSAGRSHRQCSRSPSSFHPCLPSATGPTSRCDSREHVRRPSDTGRNRLVCSSDRLSR